jgi:D-3-phosphoglycerate dehydrogenase / 2-oxoglutarate reductase
LYQDATDAYEIRGKTLGIVGYGHIGSQVSIMAEALGMRVLFYDVAPVMPHGLAQAVGSLAEVLQSSDFVSLHVPDGPGTVGLIGAAELSQMKPRSYLLNASRGRVLHLNALIDALKSGHLAGAALDVYPEEPAQNGPVPTGALSATFSTLAALPNVILTPHLGGSTQEAQRAIGHQVSHALVTFIQDGTTSGAVSFPEVSLRSTPSASASHRCRLIHSHRHVPGVLKAVNKMLANLGNVCKQVCDSSGDVAYLVADIEGDNLAHVQKCRDLLTNLAAFPDTLAVRIVHQTAGHLILVK